MKLLVSSCNYGDVGKTVLITQVSRTSWTVLENHFGPGKSRKLKLKVLESPGKISLKVMMHFSSGSNGKKAAIV